jgi:hypothetical protein
MRLALVIGSYFTQKQIILIKYVTYLYYKSDYSSTKIGLQTGQRISLVFRDAHRFQTGYTSA